MTQRPPEPKGYRSNDSLHVILDALMMLRDSLTETEPWNSYDGDEDDPKLDEAGYRATLAVARWDIENRMSLKEPL